MRIVFMGSADVSSVMLRALVERQGHTVAGVVTQPDRPVGRHRHLAPCHARATAQQLGLPTLTPEKVNSPESLAQLVTWAPDVIVVVAYGQFLGRKLLALPPHGCINIHLSLLPRHRGAAPVQWSIVSGDRVSGVTAMQMDAGMDSGDILGQVADSIRPDDTAGTLHDRLAILGSQLLVRTLGDVQAGRVARTPQNAAAVTFAPKLHKEDGLLDWTRPASALALRVRGFNPWPGCFTMLPARWMHRGHGWRLKVLMAEVAEHRADRAVSPGTVVACDEQGPLVQTGEGALRLLTVQLEGGRAMTGHAFLSGHALRAGDRFLQEPAEGI